MCAAACLLAVSVPAFGQLVARFEVRESVISPDGDGKQDSTRVRYALADTALAVSVVVFAADSTTPVDTLRSPAPDVPPAVRDLYWKGRRWDGTAAPEGAYVVTLRATGKSFPDTLIRLPVFVDLTPPTVQILGVSPNPYAPGLAGSPPGAGISHVIGNTSPVAPGRVADQLKIELFNPSGTILASPDLTTTPPFAGAGGSYVTTWTASADATSLPDGEYRATITVSDAGGYTARSNYHFEVDTKDPSIRVTSLAENARLRVVPDSARGSAFDARGVDSLYAAYPSGPFQRVTSATVRNDSLVFSVPLADSVAAEGPFALRFRAVDGVGRTGRYTFTITYDISAPAAPVLDSFDGAWRTVIFPLSGTADNGGDAASVVRILRNGTQVDSVATVLSKRFTVNVPLVVGRNDLVAVQRDGAGNLGAPSNRVTVTFKSSAGLFFPVPFAPGGRFNVNADRVAASVTLRVFDVAGDLVTFFDDETARQHYVFAWDGRNSSGVNVRRGPLVAVASIDYGDGTRDVFREVFLFDSNR